MTAFIDNLSFPAAFTSLKRCRPSSLMLSHGPGNEKSDKSTSSPSVKAFTLHGWRESRSLCTFVVVTLLLASGIWLFKQKKTFPLTINETSSWFTLRIAFSTNGWFLISRATVCTVAGNLFLLSFFEKLEPKFDFPSPFVLF